MSIKKADNAISINGNEVRFGYAVDTVLEFPEYCIVLLLEDEIPDNNVEAVDYNGNIVWNISQIIKLQYPEAYISLRKESATTFSVVSYNGVRFVVDITTRRVVNKSMTK